MDSEKLIAQPVECANNRIDGFSPQHVLHALFHFTGSLVGERYSQDSVRRHLFLRNQPGNAIDQHCRFPAARTRGDQKWSIRRRNRLFLPWIQLRKIIRNVIQV